MGRYDRTEEFDILAEGLVGDFMVFRVIVDSDSKPLNALLLKSEITKFFMDESVGEWRIGNHFPGDRRTPRVPFENFEDRDIFVLMDNLVDATIFKDRFINN